MTALWVTLAGAGGVLARYGIATAAGPGAGLWAIGAINVAGSFLLGLALAGGWWSEEARLAVGTGFLGGFTTYSTFTVQAVTEADGGRAATAALYVAASVALGLLAAWAGLQLGGRA
jgi:CrcB protein